MSFSCIAYLHYHQGNLFTVIVVKPTLQSCSRGDARDPDSVRAPERILIKDMSGESCGKLT